MFYWQDVMRPLPPVLSVHASLDDILGRICTSEESELFLLEKDGAIIGYSSYFRLMDYIRNTGGTDDPFPYETDLVPVSVGKPVAFYHNMRVYVIYNAQGIPVGCTTREDAENKMAHLRLREMKRTFDSAGIGLITTDLAFRITSMNETAESLLGLRQDLLIGRDYRSLIDTEADLEAVLCGKRFFNKVSRFNHKELIGNFSPVRDKKEIHGVIHLFYQREQYEASLNEIEYVRNLNADLQALYSSSNEEIIVVNHEGTIIRVAGTLQKEFWQTDNPSELIGLNTLELEANSFFSPSVTRLVLESGKKEGTVQTTRSGHKMWAVGTPIYHNNQLERIVIISRDISELNQLREEVAEVKRQKQTALIYRSKKMEVIAEKARRIAQVDSTILLIGESGVGKEVLATLIHQESPRSKGPFIRVNCSAIPETLIESELFGYEKGAFTGADAAGKPGFFEMAHGGTIFLDEVSELPLHLQAKLLRVLQEKEIIRVGGTKTFSISIRVIAASNRNLEEMVRQGQFRQDLYYRLNVIPIRIPPLRERREDIMSLAMHFLLKFNEMYGLNKNFSRDAIRVLEGYDWPGNVRELQNIVERLMVTSGRDLITEEEVIPALYDTPLSRNKDTFTITEIMPLKDAVEKVETELIRLAMQKYRTAAEVARVLEVSPATISRKINQLIKKKS
ncbi:sigma 54-interacting transcriptional regulator [Aneurinibacillus sp. UBA3580]|jgi:PAS domain S-box-containing protein|uniref:sigma 54-interacting transcriptional regulator n=1 Tax=Aneurinibacillus sp. UBA3580 TaxID=1946041 RepID=UPI00257E7BE7|nr:sigma 54-interacting transcriptional regulator [Aneurinibacillus sp. UBA3580]